MQAEPPAEVRLFDMKKQGRKKMPDRINGNSFDDFENKSAGEQAEIVEALQSQTRDDLAQDTVEAWEIYRQKTSTAAAQEKAGGGVIPDP